MIIRRQRITIIHTGKPSRELNDEIQWFCNSIGLFTNRDRDSSCYRVFVELLKATRARQALSSDAIGLNLSLSRGTVMHHINRLMEAGVVSESHSRYALRVGNLEVLVSEIENDIRDTCNELRKIAKRIDRELGM